MQLTIRKLSSWLYSNDSIVKAWRQQRMSNFLSWVKPPQSGRILDLGGTPYVWELLVHNFNVTLVNLPGTFTPTDSLDRLTFVEGDATDMSDLFEDKSFDVVFSNSVIEHVGDEAKQAAFAAEVRRLANSYWVQTPSENFPIEVHTGVPYYWKLPQSLRNYLHRSWEKKLPAWTQMVKETRVLSKTRMSQLFPDGEIYIERRYTFEKSYSAYRPFQAS